MMGTHVAEVRASQLVGSWICGTDALMPNDGHVEDLMHKASMANQVWDLLQPSDADDGTLWTSMHGKTLVGLEIDCHPTSASVYTPERDPPRILSRYDRALTPEPAPVWSKSLVLSRLDPGI